MKQLLTLFNNLYFIKIKKINCRNIIFLLSGHNILGPPLNCCINNYTDIEVGIKKPITKAELIDNEQFRTLNSHLMSLFYRGVAENIGHEVYL